MNLEDKLLDNQRRIGLTGGIASGKSTIANYIATKKGIKTLNADDYSKKLLLFNNQSYKKMINHFGNELEDKSSKEKKINTKLLRKIIFDDSKAKKWIENLLHPLIKENMIKDCIKLKKEKTLLLEIPLLYEAGFESLCTEIWLIKCPKKIQKERLMLRDNINNQDAEKIINIQKNLIDKEKKSDFIIENSVEKKFMFKIIDRLI